MLWGWTEDRHTLAGLSSGIAARRAGVLLDVKGATTWIRSQYSCLFPFRLDVDSQINGPESSISSPTGSGENVPQRLQRVCVLLWRLPKLEVPFAVKSQCQFRDAFSMCRGSERGLRLCRCGGERRTHFGSGTRIGLDQYNERRSEVEELRTLGRRPGG